MYTNRSEYSQRWQPSDRSSRYEYDDRRHREEHGERREERREPHRDRQWDSHVKYSMDGRRSPERTSRSREYSDSPKRLYSKEPSNRDWRRKSPVRRRMSSPSWDEKKRPRFAEEDERDYRYRSEPQGKTYRQLSDGSSRAHEPKDYRNTSPREEEYNYRKTPQETRHRHQHEEFTYRRYDDGDDDDDDVAYRQQSGCYGDGDGGERSQERARSPDHTTTSYSTSRRRTDSPSTSSMYEDAHHNRTLLNGSSGQSFESDITAQSVSVSEDKFSKGFQRFLDVLNKGVNVDFLTKIVTQSSAGVNSRPRSPGPHPNPAERPWPERQQGSHHENHCWGKSEGSQRPVSPQPRHRSLSPQQVCLSEGRPLQRSNDRQSLFDSRSPPLAVETMTLTAEDEHKCRQMQDVLQAIGLDLGFEELGQMSHRIQERLYGKRDGDWGHKTSQESGTRRAFSPKRQSSSSSGRSSFSPLPRDYYTNKDSHSAQRDTEGHQEQVSEVFDQSSSSLQDTETRDANAEERAAALQAFSPDSAYTVSEPPPAPAMPTYSPVSHLPLQYQGLPPPIPPALPPALSSSLPPVLPPALPALWPPHIGPRIFLPHGPPIFPYPGVRPLNILPNMLAQRNLLPPHMNNPPFNLPGVNAIQPLNTQQKSKQLSRPRCLQVIETKQPG
ncbi:cyclin-dependent kinase 12-like isoform X2 [Parambassis ranga]|uniref:Cyclin-dependent kinase 12-like isoform X2 n=1 Tax=Parambassis ranga TaxID=210632 RepID=A0A6P7I0B2_9TELE|nr:cyclin-dependent kinase 12-like isoform X2 [Parambassis ranga]XP_028256168.1 cyclin-dependent kinase 12-like isoform X2 [Parambassis ranga]XP_028256237.1 cyclin-dependent kinase 12-like isoform X2 [Parambassis ranga]